MLSTISTVKDFESHIAKAISAYVEQEVKLAIEEVKIRIDKKLPEIVATIGVQVASYMDQMKQESVLQIRLTPGSFHS